VRNMSYYCNVLLHRLAKGFVTRATHRYLIWQSASHAL
jgi:hypothetical protein